MDTWDFYMQNSFVYARRIGISIGEHIDGHFNRTMHRYILSIRFNYVKVNSNAFVQWIPLNYIYIHLFLLLLLLLQLFLSHSISHSNCAHFLFKNHFNRQYKVAVTMIWLIALSVNLPWLYVFQLEPIELGSNRKVSP